LLGVSGGARIDTRENLAYNDNMNRKPRWCLIVLLQIVLAFGVQASVPAGSVSFQAESQRYFPETGHWVTGDFMKTYGSVPDPVLIFGYPITEAFQEQTYGRIVQYFQRAVFELHPENPPELRVRISELGKHLYQPGIPLAVPENFPACEYFTETSHQVCYAFLEFFNENGGAALFGYPISDFEIHDDRIVQYFQRARFEWHPERPAGQRVVLSDLGKMYFDMIGENPVRLLAAPRNLIPQSILNLKVRAYPAEAALPQTASQTIYILVQDQNLQPVSQVQATLEVRYPNGEVQRIVIPKFTDKDGMVSQPITFTDQPVGLVEVTVRVMYENLRAETVTSFRIWY